MTTGLGARRRFRLFGEWLAVSFAALALLLALTVGGAARRLDDGLYGFIMQWRNEPAPPNILIVAIDERSLKQFGRWPWNRRVQAMLVHKIAVSRPAVIGYDVVLTEPGDVEGDAALAAAFREAKVFAPLQLAPGADGGRVTVLEPPPIFKSALAGLGQADIDFDADGVVRRMFLSESDGARLWPNLMWTITQAMGGRPPPKLIGPKVEGFGLARGDEVLIPYLGRQGAIRQVSAADVLSDSVPLFFVRDQIVLVGATAVGLADSFPTPTSGSDTTPGVEIHASVLNGLLTGRMIRAATPEFTFVVSAAIVVVFLTGFLIAPPRRNLQIGFLLALGVSLGSAAALLLERFWLSPVPSLVAFALVLPIWGWRRLHAASVYLAQELENLQANVGDPITQAPPARLPADLVERQMDLLQNATAHLANLRQFLSDVIAHLPEAAIAVDEDGAVLLANQTAQALARSLEVSAGTGDPVGQILNKLHAVDGRAALWPPDSGAGGRLRAAAPGDRQFEVVYAPWRDAMGARRGWVIDISDVTQLTGALRQREEALQLFSHDMRSPQAAILALLQRPEMAPAPDDLKGRIAGHARRSLALAEGFVQLARAQGAEYRFEIADLAHLLSDAADELWIAAQSKAVSITLCLPDEEALARLDRGLMTRVLINLLDNAVKYSDQGGSVEAGVSLTETTVVCFIADHGRGLDEAVASRLFERFASQGGVAENRTGAGLGLAFCHQVILRHFGVIRCESRPGAGARFVIDLPRAKAGAGEAS